MEKEKNKHLLKFGNTETHGIGLVPIYDRCHGQSVVNMLLLVKHKAGQKIVLPFIFENQVFDLGWFQKDMKIEEYLE